MPIDLNDPRRADARGWGPGWEGPGSTCQRSKWVELSVLSLRGRVVRIPPHRLGTHRGHFVFEEDVSFPGGVREEIHELVSLLLQVSERRGHINLQPGWCWGAGCRPIKLSDGTFTDVPSNHSWGLAVDLNAPVNQLGGSTHTIPRRMANLWNAFGFRWGGDFSTTKDWMHFEFMGTPDDAKGMTERAVDELSGEVEVLTPEQERAIRRMSAFLEALTEELGRHDEDDVGGTGDDKATPGGAAKRVAKTVLVAEAGGVSDGPGRGNDADPT
jgi:hypothetical protein